MLLNFLKTDNHGREVDMSVWEPIRSTRDLLKAFKKSAEAESERVKEIRRRKVEEVPEEEVGVGGEVYFYEAVTFNR